MVPDKYFVEHPPYHADSCACDVRVFKVVHFFSLVSTPLPYFKQQSREREVKAVPLIIIENSFSSVYWLSIGGIFEDLSAGLDCGGGAMVKMSSLMHLVVENYNEFAESRDPTVDSWLFMKTPIPVVTILLAYLYFVLKLGPQLMAKRKAFDLKLLMIFYNAYQVLFSIWLCSQALKVKKPVQLLSHTCKNPSTDKEFQEVLSNGAWWYFFSKVVELLDTVFFVLRKKQSQVTFLHVYHHACTMFFSWGYLKFLPGEQGVVIGFLNSLVHVVMYFYYFLSALGPKYQKYLWWKKYMTWIQLTQFCIMLAYLVFIIAMDCKLPKALTFFFVGNVVIFLYLFSDFYRKAYKKNPAVTKELPNTSNSDRELEKAKVN